MKTEFLYASIADTQGTIRSIDARAGFLFVVLSLPLSMLDKISAILPSHLHRVEKALVFADLLLWVLAMLILFRCIVATHNPAAHVSGTPTSGTFYGADLFALRKRHIIFGSSLQSLRDVDSEKDIIPAKEDDVVRELVYEKIKLAYIRDIKLQRFAASTFFTLVWLIFSGALAFCTRVMA